jgi:hexosaminidase
MASVPLLLPSPRSYTLEEGTVPLAAQRTIRLNAPNVRELMPAARVLQAAVRRATGFEWQVVAGAHGTGGAGDVVIELYDGVEHPQGYHLSVKQPGDRITISGRDPAGAYYGAQTLAQLIRQFPDALPCLEIEDWPDFPARGVMLDVSRDKVPTMETLYGLVDQLAEWKINQLQLYTEHTFAYRGHPEVWAEASPLTGEEILALDAYCRERFVELVPNQNSFGHMERWLKFPRYAPLAEAPDGFEYPWGGRMEEPFSLCPGDPGSIQLVESLYEELLPHFSSPLFNVGCDETFDLGQGRSKEACEERGTERVYLDFLLQVYRLVKDRDRTMQFWGDIILHKPELIPELPKDAIALEWGYEADHPFDKDGRLFHEAGIPFYVCPGTSTWNTLAGRTDNALGNLRSAAENGVKHGAIGYLITDWGDNGHLQYLPASYLGFAAGAAYSWCLDANREVSVPAALDRHVFHDRAGVMGKLAYDLGNVYQGIGKRVDNASALFHIILYGPEHETALKGVTGEGLDAAEAAIDTTIETLERARLDRPDAGLIVDEYRNTAAMLRFACRLGRYRLGDGAEPKESLATELRRIVGEHRRLWLARNRVGGLLDSAKRLEARLEELV